MWPARAFSVARGSIHEKSSNLKIFEKCEVTFVALKCLIKCICARTARLSLKLFLCTVIVHVFFYLLYDQIRRYDPALNAAFSKWPPSQIICPPLA